MIPKLAAILKPNSIVAVTAKCAFRWKEFATAKTTVEIGPTNLKTFVTSMNAVKVPRSVEAAINNVLTCLLDTNVLANKAISSWETLHV